MRPIMAVDFAVAIALLAFVLAALSLAFAWRVLTGVEKQHEQFLKGHVNAFRAELVKSTREVTRLGNELAAVDQSTGKAISAQLAAIGDLKKELAALNVRLSVLEKPAVRADAPSRFETLHKVA
jgi:hypothetical protein